MSCWLRPNRGSFIVFVCSPWIMFTRSKWQVQSWIMDLWNLLRTRHIKDHQRRVKRIKTHSGKSLNPLEEFITIACRWSYPRVLCLVVYKGCFAPFSRINRLLSRGIHHRRWCHSVCLCLLTKMLGISFSVVYRLNELFCYFDFVECLGSWLVQ